MSEESRIYVADLAAYNAGYLHGVWIEATNNLDDIWAQIRGMLKASPVSGAEEYAVHDFEGFGGYSVSEHEGIDNLHEIACFLEDCPDFGGELLNHCSDLEEAQRMAEDAYCGCFESLAGYARDLTEQTGNVPQHLEYYIDYERMGRDMEMSGDIFTIETSYQEVHVFS